MASAFSKIIRSYMAQTFIKSVKEQQEKKWTASTAYSLGETFVHNGARYAVTSTGLSGLVGPSHLQGIATNGTTSLLFIEQIKAQNNFQGNLYLTLGAPDEWDDEDNPPNPDMSDRLDEEYKSDIISLKKLSKAEMSMAAPTVRWVSGTVFDQYNEEQVYTRPFYCMTSEKRVYKCINNNNGAGSTIEPTSESVAGNIALGDGYVWKYLFTISEIDNQLFMADNFFPVSLKVENDGSVQWQVQQAASLSGISTFVPITDTSSMIFSTAPSYVISAEDGSGVVVNIIKNTEDKLQSVLANSPGTGYTKTPYALIQESDALGTGCEATATIVSGAIDSITVDENGSNYEDALVFIVGDGTGATATATVEPTGIISAISVDTSGVGYTWAKVFIIPGNVGVVAKGILAPLHGHGANPVVELLATTIIINATIPNDEHFLTGVDGDFRQIGIITDIKDQDGNFAFDSAYIGPGHPDFTDDESILNKIEQYSGFFLYMNNITPVTRVEGQEERVKIVIPI